MPDRVLDAVQQWQSFANTLMVTWNGRRRSWKDQISGSGFADEISLVQPVVFPAFAKQLLGWTEENLFAEQADVEGRPDFRPDDQVTHPFVFETKGTSEGPALTGHDAQIRRYLVEGQPRIRHVVLTNLLGMRVFSLNDAGNTYERIRINLRSLTAGAAEVVATTAEAARFADVLDEFRRQELTAAEKIARVRASPPWNPISETTSSGWIVSRLDRTGFSLSQDALQQIRDGVLVRPTVTTNSERNSILTELRMLAARLGTEDADTKSLVDFLSATGNSDLAVAMTQYASHVAYYATTRLMLVRVWEDLNLLEPMLFDGGFNQQMIRFDDAIGDVVGHSFAQARNRYRALFDQKNNYTWYTPSNDTYADTIYQFANTYLGSIESDVLGQVYERMLERIDRKLRGVYYTPRDIIHLIWDLVGFDAAAEQAEADDRQLRVLDIATGSGGFIVEAVRRLRERALLLRSQGADQDTQEWLNQVADGINGVEFQTFSAYLAELNLLVQLGQVIVSDVHRPCPSWVCCAETP